MISSKTLRALLDGGERQARFWNTLSLLEYIGARKILKSQPQKTLSLEVLAHAAEEVQHAQVLKRAALKMAPKLCVDYQPDALLGGEATSGYLQAVDDATESELGSDSFFCYLATTLLVEERATAFYEKIEAALIARGQPSVFRSILNQEQRHLEQVRAWLSAVPDVADKLNRLRQVEGAAFERFAAALDASVNFLPSGRHSESDGSDIDSPLRC